jgi:hypothetical protein
LHNLAGKAKMNRFSVLVENRILIGKPCWEAFCEAFLRSLFRNLGFATGAAGGVNPKVADVIKLPQPDIQAA